MLGLFCPIELSCLVFIWDSLESEGFYWVVFSLHLKYKLELLHRPYKNSKVSLKKQRSRSSIPGKAHLNICPRKRKLWLWVKYHTDLQQAIMLHMQQTESVHCTNSRNCTELTAGPLETSSVTRPELMTDYGVVC